VARPGRRRRVRGHQPRAPASRGRNGRAGRAAAARHRGD
jgi:hypothetical protein